MIAEEWEFFDQSRDFLCCPRCGGTLELASASVVCVKCRHPYQSIDGIPSFFAPNQWDGGKRDVTQEIQSFYERTPFPDYDELDSAASLVDKARAGIFARLLDEQIPFGARVLECGCGTGQLTNFLAIANRTVIGTDICLNSLAMATDFKRRNELKRAHFLQMNLFRPCFKPESFDLVISNGVLHHTSDPYLGFKTISTLVRPGGYLLVGLYHKYGRLATDLRRWIFNLTGDRFAFLDRHGTDPRVSRAKRNAWFMDQYRNPHESKHTIGETLGWLRLAGLTFVNSLPKTVPFVSIDDSEKLFAPHRPGNVIERLIVNIGMICSGHLEGGFFIVIARKPFTKS